MFEDIKILKVSKLSDFKRVFCDLDGWKQGYKENFVWYLHNENPQCWKLQTAAPNESDQKGKFHSPRASTNKIKNVGQLQNSMNNSIRSKEIIPCIWIDAIPTHTCCHVNSTSKQHTRYAMIQYPVILHNYHFWLLLVMSDSVRSRLLLKYSPQDWEWQELFSKMRHLQDQLKQEKEESFIWIMGWNGTPIYYKQ